MYSGITMKDKTVLILGSSSDLGVIVVEKFLKKGWKVLAHYNSNNKKLKNLEKKEKKIELIQANFNNINSINYIKKKITKENIISYVNLIGFVSKKSY